jgi:hypothetical protein
MKKYFRRSSVNEPDFSALMFAGGTGTNPPLKSSNESTGLSGS